jgi:hypothetical protein
MVGADWSPIPGQRVEWTGEPGDLGTVITMPHTNRHGRIEALVQWDNQHPDCPEWMLTGNLRPGTLPK